MQLRSLRDADIDALESFDLGDGSEVWLREVREIVAGLHSWAHSADAVPLDRQVVVLTDHDDIVGVAAHEAIHSDSGQVFREHRYLMVVAIAARRQRGGLAALLTTSVLEHLRASGTNTVTWLVHPRNHASIAFSRRAFPEADETYPPEDKPYVSFTLNL